MLKNWKLTSSGNTSSSAYRPLVGSNISNVNSGKMSISQPHIDNGTDSEVVSSATMSLQQPKKPQSLADMLMNKSQNSLPMPLPQEHILLFKQFRVVDRLQFRKDLEDLQVPIFKPSYRRILK